MLHALVALQPYVHTIIQNHSTSLLINNVEEDNNASVNTFQTNQVVEYLNVCDKCYLRNGETSICPHTILHIYTDEISSVGHPNRSLYFTCHILTLHRSNMCDVSIQVF